jgi:NNP family nitrate/nitrite transporter-like MFS transporter
MPNPSKYAFLGPLIGLLIRPLGGWLSDRFGGALVTQIDIAVMIGATIGVGVMGQTTVGADRPEEQFPLFFFLLGLLVTTSIANGSTFKQISTIYSMTTSIANGSTFKQISTIYSMTTSIANGSTFKQISTIYSELDQPHWAGPVLGWSSAIASFGAFVIPRIIGFAMAEKPSPPTCRVSLPTTACASS